jgi:hypothetical protein
MGQVASCDLSRDRNGPEPSLGPGLFLCGAGWAAGGLVVPGGVEDEFAEQFAGGGVEDADAQVLDQEQDVGSGVGAADADVVEAAAGAEGEVACLADLAVADSVVGISLRSPGTALGRAW